MQILFGEPEGKGSLTRLRCRWTCSDPVVIWTYGGGGPDCLEIRNTELMTYKLSFNAKVKPHKAEMLYQIVYNNNSNNNNNVL